MLFKTAATLSLAAASRRFMSSDCGALASGKGCSFDPISSVLVPSIPYAGQAATDVSTAKKCAEQFFTLAAARSDPYCLQHIVMTLPVDITAGAADGWCEDADGAACSATSEAANVAVCIGSKNVNAIAWTASS